jgi:hypothetical protein
VLDIRLHELKKMIFDRTNDRLQSYGYRGNKSEMIFTKKDKVKKIIIAWGFSEYYPIDYQFSFGATITYPILHKAVSDFYQAVDSTTPAKWNLSLFEGQFVKELIGATPKEKRSYYHSVASKRYANIFVEESIETLSCKMLPFINEVEDFEHFQKFIIDNPNYLKENFENTEFFVSALLSVKLKDKIEFERLYAIMKNVLLLEKQNGKNYSKHIFYLEKLFFFN